MPYSQLIQRFNTIRQQTEAICAPLSPEDMVVQVMLDASPPKWHLAHTTWFFETFLLKPHLANYQEFNPDFGFLFNSYTKVLASGYSEPIGVILPVPL